VGFFRREKNAKTIVVIAVSASEVKKKQWAVLPEVI